jgi:uncharacterized membrane protein YqaE (UPF0057 family)
MDELRYLLTFLLVFAGVFLGVGWLMVNLPLPPLLTLAACIPVVWVLLDLVQP